MSLGRPRRPAGTIRITQPLGIGKHAEVKEAMFDYSSADYRFPFWMAKSGTQVLVIEEDSDTSTYKFREFSSPCSWEFIPDD